MSSFSNCRVLVTGGAGFIGGHIAQQLVDKGAQVCVIDDLSTGRKENVPSKAEFVQGDICDREVVAKLMKDFKPTQICHQAAQTSVSVSTREPFRDAQTNVIGTLNLLRACEGQGVKDFVFASTGGAIYGEVAPGDKANQSRFPAPKSPYACSKLAAEYYIQAECGAMNMGCTILRYANVFGPRQDPHGEAGVVAIFCKLALQGKPLTVFAQVDEGDDGCVRDYTYVGDVVSANLAALAGELKSPLLDIGTGVPSTTKALAQTIIAAAGSSSDIAYGPQRKGDVLASVLDPSQFHQEVGQTTALAKGIAETVAWFRTRDA